MGLPPLISYTWLDSQCLETPTSLCSSHSNFIFLVWGQFCDMVSVSALVCMQGGGGALECFLVTQGTQQVPLVDNYVRDTCLFIGLQIFRTRSKNFYWTISQVRFLSLKSQAALTHGLNEDSGISSPACSSLPVPSSGPLCSLKGDYFKFPALH